MAKKTKSAKGGKSRERHEQRFEPRTSNEPSHRVPSGRHRRGGDGGGDVGRVRSAGARGGPEPFKYAPYILAVGAVLVGIAIWVGTSGEPPLRVGDGGLAVERAGIRRMPWYAVERVSWGEDAMRVTGKDEAGASMTIVASLASHPDTAAWIAKEARERVPHAVEIPESATIPPFRADAGEGLRLEAPHVVGKRCVASGTAIAYEPDARVCPRCGRVYHKEHVPESCECGATLSEFRTQTKTG